LSDVQWKSPFDSCPGTTYSVPLTNLQVNVDGTNISNLFSQAWWEWSRFYYVDIERSAEVDQMGPRNIEISFTNGGLLNVDVTVIYIYIE
jgi:hypothetical protein